VIFAASGLGVTALDSRPWPASPHVGPRKTRNGKNLNTKHTKKKKRKRKKEVFFRVFRPFVSFVAKPGADMSR